MWTFFNSSEYTKAAILIIVIGIGTLAVIHTILKKYFK